MGILPDSAADNGQIKIGDEVVKINSIKTEELSLIDIVNILRNNTELNLKYLSDNQLKNITLKKEKLFSGQ
ncbi:MAG: PDZ domain-containing protein [Deltaproteobacteria bacterium]|nr:PDZ domain-containing protein [Deltaproteobacteria bacterium]